MLTEAKFNYYKTVFHKKVTESPAKATFYIRDTVYQNSFDAFIGQAEEVLVKTITLKILYDRDKSDFVRQPSYGIENSQSGVIYISEKQVVENKIDFNLVTHINFFGKNYYIGGIDKLEPLYDSYIAVKIVLTSETKN